MSSIKDLPSVLGGLNGYEISVKKLDDSDLIFSVVNDDFEEEFFCVKKPYRWGAEIVAMIEAETVPIIQVKKVLFEMSGKVCGRLDFLGVV